MTIRESLEQCAMRCAQRVAARAKPGLIAVTGGNAKPAARAIAAVIAGTRPTMTMLEAPRDDLKPALAILGCARYIDTFWFSASLALRGIMKCIRKTPCPELIIMACAPRDASEAENAIKIARPHITVVTDGLRDTAMANNMPYVAALPSNGLVIPDADDHGALMSAEATRAHAISFGRGDAADMRITDAVTSAGQGTCISLAYGARQTPLYMEQARGDGAMRAAAAAAACGTAFGLNLQRIAETLRHFKG
jgi:hypothetical protein